MTANRATVLILSSDPSFARQVSANWPAEPPEFVVLKEDLCADLRRDAYDLAVAEASANAAAMIDALTAAAKPAIFVHSSSVAPRGSVQGPVVFISKRAETWPAIIGVLGAEILRREQAEGRANLAEQACAVVEAEAMLGRYMVEMRHTVSNALTSVLGNAELLLHEPGLPASSLTQADTIRNMALRLHEVFQRFSSIEKELSVVAREAGKRIETAPQARGTTAR